MPRYARRIETRMVTERDFPYKREQFDRSQTIANFCNVLQDSDIEKLLVLHLDGQNRLNCIQIQTGTVNRAAAYVREIIKHALLSSSSGMAIVHNHPSGDPCFSEHDILFTRKLKIACEVMELTLLDHVLLTGEGRHISMADQGIL